jgi:outer membrane receptor protein involved in Fe transport
MSYGGSMKLSLALGCCVQSVVVSTAFGQQTGEPPSAAAMIDEVVVTAQRREQSVQDVPISISVYSQESMDMQGVRDVDAIAKLTPGITFSRAEARNGSATTISIRGISSAAGASTTGIYIDDTPIQVRSLGFGGFNAFPQVFDLQRIEVLRGPQGTLFGAGSEGGTVRFITNPPDLQRNSTYVRSEAGFTEYGGESYEVGAAGGGPIVDDKLGFRISGSFRHDGGWVDHALFPSQQITDEDSNWLETSVARASLKYVPTAGLTISPSLFYQRLNSHDSSGYWSAVSDADAGRFYNDNPSRSPSHDEFLLPALKIEWELGSVNFVSNSSYFHRDQDSDADYTVFNRAILGMGLPLPAGALAVSHFTNTQRTYTQELRLQSAEPEARLQWIAGLYYQHATANATQSVSDPTLAAEFQALTGIPFAAIFQQSPIDGRVIYLQDPYEGVDEEMAAFGQVDYKLLDRWTLTAGVRVSRTQFDGKSTFAGPFADPTVLSSSGSIEETPVSPKVGVAYQATPDINLYATVAKGYRIGGYNPQLFSICQQALPAGFSASAVPTTYKSDRVLSYEVGMKNSLLDRRVQLNASIYQVDWSEIQQAITLQACGAGWVDNLGSATSRGADLQVDWRVTDDVSTGLSAGYTKAKYDRDVSIGTAKLVTSGDYIAAAPWSLAWYGQYSFDLFGHSAYARFDYQHQPAQSDRVAQQSPLNALQFNPDYYAIPTLDQLALRLGASWGRAEISLFANNVLGEDTPVNRQAGVGVPAVRVPQDIILRPRTYGLTATYRY